MPFLRETKCGSCGNPASSAPLKMKNASRRSLRLLRLLLTPTFSLSFSETAQRVMFRQAPKRKAPATITELARRVFQVKHNLQLVPGVIPWLERLAEEYRGDLTVDEAEEVWDESAVLSAFENLVTGCQGTGIDAPKMITIELLEKVHDDLMLEGEAVGDEDGDDLESKHYLHIVNADKMPPWRWGEESKMFELAPKPASIAPPATAKARYMRDRFNIIKQVVLRNEHFSAPAIPDHLRSEYMKLTSIKNLLGRQGNHFLIFGLLARMEDGAFYLEDLDDKVELDLSEATPQSGLFTEGSFVLVDGDYMADSRFKVNEMGYPPSEPRKDAMKIFGHHDFLGLGALSIEEQAKLLESEQSPRNRTSFIVLSDVHLDNHKVMKALGEVLGAYEGMEQNDQPSLFILFGNFRSRPYLCDGSSSREYEELFGSLARLLATFPSLLAHSQFLLIPGPSDPYSAQMLPQSPLPPLMVRELVRRVPNITFGSNPCRIRYFTQEIVLFRDDVMSRMMRNAVHMGPEREGTDLRKALVQTILDQAHLAPLPLTVRPVYWEKDHALRLYPMPTTLVLADKFDPYKLVYDDCLVFNPGSFARRKFSWSTYHPHMEQPKERMEESELPGPDDD